MTDTHKPDTTPKTEHAADTADTAGTTDTAEVQTDAASSTAPAMPKEVGGRKGPEPTRYGDWERNGIISDF